MASNEPLVEHEHLEFDVSAYAAKFCACLTQKLYLEDEEAVLKTSHCMGTSEKRLPYGELGSVDEITAWGCFASFKSDLSPVDPRTNKKMPITPGCGCSTGLVHQIVTELKARMKGRGDTGNIHRAEESILRQDYLNDKVSMLMKSVGVVEPKSLLSAEDKVMDMQLFEHLEYDVTPGYCGPCFCTKHELTLEAEEVLLVKTTLCSTEVKRFPYGQLQNVTQAKMCCCCVIVKSEELGALTPGCGCDVAKVEEIAKHLKERMKARGDTGNIKRQEHANKLARDSDRMLDAILTYYRIPIPPMPDGLAAAPIRHTMA